MRINLFGKYKEKIGSEQKAHIYKCEKNDQLKFFVDKTGSIGPYPSFSWHNEKVRFPVPFYSYALISAKPISLGRQIHSPLLGEKVDYVIGLSYRHASLCIV